MTVTSVPVGEYAGARADFKAGSKSFAAAALLFDRNTRRDTTLLYAWCRHCDDVVDNQVLGFGAVGAAQDPAAAIALLREQTRLAFVGQAAPGTVFAGLQAVAARCAIPERFAREHLLGFAMDVDGRQYATIEDTLDYCYHVAGVVGLMMGHVMGVRDDTTMQRACDLGIAFQLTNIARDLVEDAARGRVYVPDQWLAQEGIAGRDIGRADAAPALARIAARLIDLSQQYYSSARVGVDALSWRSAMAVGTAARVYRHIGLKILRRGDQAWLQRVHTGSGIKLALAIRAALSVIDSRQPVAQLRLRRSIANSPRHLAWNGNQQ